MCTKFKLFAFYIVKKMKKISKKLSYHIENACYDVKIWMAFSLQESFGFIKAARSYVCT